jgi:arsenite methyltransferase
MPNPTQTTTTPEHVRRNVSEAYAQAISRDAACCATQESPSGCSNIGYRPADLADVPADAAAHTFGCGNPLAFSDVKSGDTVLDLGSGAGLDLLVASKQVGPAGRVIGVDMTPEMVERARKNVAAAGAGNVEVRQGLIENLPLPSESVDWVISNCVINLSPEKHKVFAEIARVLRPGGRMRVADMVVEDLPDWARRSEALYCGCVAGAISESEYTDGLRSAGLTDVQVLNRMEYGAAQLKAAVAHDPTAAQAAQSCCASGAVDSVDTLIESLSGRIRSVIFTARKPE